MRAVKREEGGEKIGWGRGGQGGGGNKSAAPSDLAASSFI